MEKDPLKLEGAVQNCSEKETRFNRTLSHWNFACLALFIIVFVFGSYEIIERVWLKDVDARLIRFLHLVRGIGSTLLVSGLTIWHLTRGTNAPTFRKVSSDFGTLAFEKPDVAVEWFINLRWMVIVGAATAVFLCRHVLEWLPHEVTGPLWLGIAVLLLANIAFLRIRNRTKNLGSMLLWQIALDIAILTYLLHFSGGIENPLFVVYVFHVILAGVLVPREKVYLVSAGTIALFLVMAFGEHLYLWEHYTLSLFPHENLTADGLVSHAAHKRPFVAGISGAFVALILVTTYFITTIMDRLRESQSQLLRTERLSTLGHLVAYIAHEINNPIGIISTRAKLARLGSLDSFDPEFLKETLEIVDRQSERVGKVVQSLLGFSKSLPEIKSAVDLNQALSEALSIAQPKISQKGIVLERMLDHSIPKIQARFNDLVHVFLNLINNAIDAMPRGGVLTAKTQASNGSIETVIADTGEGISQENMEKLFEPFFTTKTRDQGTGLGLPISLSLVKALGGEIKVESSRGKGSSFKVVFPVPTSGDGLLLPAGQGSVLRSNAETAVS
ncbi:MAG: hypothetical protein HYT79_02750 [Elusimicrobia bacterium]|nr:hypothetical protein [Elusimicrobiota bacterium]